jgi:hypothetical protein
VASGILSIFDIMTKADWDAIVVSRANTVLYGPPAGLETSLARLEPYLHSPAHLCVGGRYWSSPEQWKSTLIVDRIADCTVEQQKLLNHVLEAVSPRLQVISTTDRRLFNLVARGDFPASLYYRLNAVYVELDARW